MSFVGDIVDSITGKGEREAANRGAEAMQRSNQEARAELRRATGEAQGYYEPYSDLGGLGIDQIGFMTDPQAQFDWLQNNPFFQMSLDNANDVTSKMSAAKGRLSAGDTLMQLSNNALLASQPLISDQKASIGNLINLGYGTTQAQANTALGLGSNLAGLMVDSGNIEANRRMAEWNAINNGLAGQIGQNISGMVGSGLTGGFQGMMPGGGGFMNGFAKGIGG